MNLTRSPEDAHLDFLVGEWRNEGQTTPGSFGPGGEITGTTAYQWDISGKWLLYTSRLVLPGLGDYTVHGGFSFNPQAGQYDAFAANSLGNLMIYTGSWEDESTLVFTLANPGVQGSARVVYRKLPDGAVQMSSERRVEGDFEAYFETTMQR